MPENQALADTPDTFPRPRDREGLRALMEHRESRHAVKYAIVGVANVTIDLVLYGLLLWLGVWYVAAKSLSLVVATLNGYTFNRIWTFRAGRHEHMTLARYVTVQAAGLAINLALLTMLVELAGRSPMVAQVIALPFVCAFTFLSNRLWTFGRHLSEA